MRAIFLLYLLLSITSGGLGSLRSPRAPEPPGPGFITPALSKFIQGLILNYDIPGLALAVVHQDGTYEAGGWGKRNEDFDFVTPEVGFRDMAIR